MRKERNETEDEGGCRGKKRDGDEVKKGKERWMKRDRRVRRCSIKLEESNDGDGDFCFCPSPQLFPSMVLSFPPSCSAASKHQLESFQLWPEVFKPLIVEAKVLPGWNESRECCL